MRLSTKSKHEISLTQEQQINALVKTLVKTQNHSDMFLTENLVISGLKI